MSNEPLMAEPPPDSPDKSQWRKWLLRSRLSLLPEERQKFEKHMADALSARAVTEGWQRVLVFLPWKGEPDLVMVWRAWHKRGIALGLPVVQAHDAPLQLTDWTPGSPMLKDLMGLPAPSAEDFSASSAQFDTWVVPCVGVDQLGYRLGAGKGFYDRTMAHRESMGLAKPRVYGVTFGSSLIPMQIAEPHDLRLDAVLTERGWRDF
jgi:5-formyltetrahydrofolate cyclo-ligase